MNSLTAIMVYLWKLEFKGNNKIPYKLFQINCMY